MLESASYTMSSRRPTAIAALAAVASLAFTGTLFAQVPDPSPQEEPIGRVGEPIDGGDRQGDGEALSLQAGVTATTAYYFRGALQLDDSGAVFQPYADIGVDLVNADDYDINGFVGTWNSFHSNSPTPPTSTAGPDAWYESRLYGGVELTTGDFQFGSVYTFYTSPNNAFNTVQELGLTAAWAPDFQLGDSDTFEWTLGLHGGVYFETEDQNGSEDSYFELGVTPGMDFNLEIGGDGSTPVSVTFPVTAGFSVDNYYFDETGDEEFFGFFSVGAQASVPLPLPRAYGDWHLSVGVQALFLEADSLVLINEGDSEAFVASAAVGFEM